VVDNSDVNLARRAPGREVRRIALELKRGAPEVAGTQVGALCKRKVEDLRELSEPYAVCSVATASRALGAAVGGEAENRLIRTQVCGGDRRKAQVARAVWSGM
jgi:hypothetical protein